VSEEIVLLPRDRIRRDLPRAPRAWDRRTPDIVTGEDLRASWRAVKAAHRAGGPLYAIAQDNFTYTLERFLNQ
jgi:hypothetical protein